MKEENNQICECGHDKMSHTWFATSPKCNIKGCECKKFKAKKVIDMYEWNKFKAKNHSPLSKRIRSSITNKDTPSDAVVSGGDIRFKSENHSEGTQNHAEKTLSDDIDFLIGYVMNVRSDEPKKYAISDLDYLLKELKSLKKKYKEAVKRLKDGWYETELSFEDYVDKIMGDDLTK